MLLPEVCRDNHSLLVFRRVVYRLSTRVGTWGKALRVGDSR